MDSLEEDVHLHYLRIASLPLLSYKDTSQVIPSPSHDGLNVPIIYSPMVHRRCVDIHNILDVSRSPSLYEQLLSTAPQPQSYINTIMDVLIFSVDTADNSTNQDGVLFATHDRRIKDTSKVAVPPSPNITVIEDFIGSHPTYSNEEYILAFIKSVLTLDFMSNQTTRFFAAHVNSIDPTNRLKNFPSIMQEVQAKIAQANLSLCCVEGNHRSLSSHFALKKLQSLTDVDFTEYRSLIASVPVKIRLFKEENGFTQKLLDQSDKYHLDRRNFFMLSMIDEFRSMDIIKINDDCLPFKGPKMFTDHLIKCYKQVIHHFGSSEYWKAKLMIGRGRTATFHNIFNPSVNEIARFELKLSCSRQRGDPSESTLFSMDKESFYFQMKTYVILFGFDTLYFNHQQSTLVDLLHAKNKWFRGYEIFSEMTIIVGYLFAISDTLGNNVVRFTTTRNNISSRRNEWGKKDTQYYTLTYLLCQFYGFMMECTDAVLDTFEKLRMRSNITVNTGNHFDTTVCTNKTSVFSFYLAVLLDWLSSRKENIVRSNQDMNFFEFCLVESNVFDLTKDSLFLHAESLKRSKQRKALVSSPRSTSSPNAQTHNPISTSSNSRKKVGIKPSAGSKRGASEIHDIDEDSNDSASTIRDETYSNHPRKSSKSTTGRTKSKNARKSTVQSRKKRTKPSATSSSSSAAEEDQDSNDSTSWSMNKQLNEYGDPLAIYDLPQQLDDLIHCKKDLRKHRKIQHWYKNKSFIFTQNTAIIPSYSKHLKDVLSGKADFHIASLKIPFKDDTGNDLKNEDGNVIAVHDIREDWESIQNDSTVMSCISTGYGRLSNADQDRLRSSRLYLKEEKVKESRARFKYLPQVFKRSNEILSAYINRNLVDVGDQYKLHNGSIIFDTGNRTHVQQPHQDMKTSNIEQKIREANSFHHPLSIVYAIDDCSLVLFPRSKSHFGETIGTRIIVPAGHALFFSCHTWHSGDRCSESEPIKKNARLHFYGVPKSLKTKDVLHNNAVDRDSDRNELLDDAVTILNTVPYNKVEEEYEKLMRMNETYVKCTHHRFNKVFCLLVKCYDFLSISLPMYGTDGSEQEMKKHQEMSNKSNLVYDMYMQEMNGMLTEDYEQQKKREISITVIGPNNTTWTNKE